MSWRFLTSGESHGRGLLVIVDGLPSGLTITRDHLTDLLARRRRGFGRGSRMALEGDELTLETQPLRLEGGGEATSVLRWRRD